MNNIDNDQFNNDSFQTQMNKDELLKNDTKKEKEQEDEENSITKFVPYLFIFTIILFFCVFGITYSIYKGTGDSDDNEIVTDQIIFTYSDVDKVGNGIYIQDATPISDSQGKVMVGKNQYFDFYITATTGKSEIVYQLLLNKDNDSTLKDNNIRIYLTQVMGGYEEEKVLVTLSDLKTRTLNKKDYRILYEKELASKLENHSDSYRLRMWVKEDATNYENQYFSVKVDVYAEQLER